MNCTYCDAALPAGATFCANCGSRVPQPSSVGATVLLPAVTEDQASAPPPQPTSAGSPTMVVPPSFGEQASAAAQPYTTQPYTPQPYTPQPYTQQSYTPQSTFTPASLPNSGSATVSLIFGILAWVLLPVIGAIIAVIAGHMARREISASNGRLGGSGMATAGLILGYVHIGVSLLACVGFVLLIAIGAAANN
jgi:hypothetical protein